MRAIALKEFLELRRDRRTVAMLFLLPFLFLVVFGYAASFDVKTIPTIVAGPAADLVASRLPDQFEVVDTRPGDDAAAAKEALSRGEAVVAVVTPASASVDAVVLVDGSELFAAQAALRRIAMAQVTADAASGAAGTLPQQAQLAMALIGKAKTDVLFNPDLRTAVVMVPGLCGIILVFVGTIATALGVVRERQSGTMEQLAVMPFRPRDVFLGKIAPVPGGRRRRHGGHRRRRHAHLRRAVQRAPSPPSRWARRSSSSSPSGPASLSPPPPRHRARRSSWPSSSWSRSSC